MDHIAAVNFTRLLDRCYHQALDPDQQIQNLSHLHKSVYILREQADTLSQTSEGLQYLEQNECQRKLSFLYQTLGLGDSKTTSHPAAFTQAENNARLKYKNQALDQQRRNLFRQTQPFGSDDGDADIDQKSPPNSINTVTAVKPSTKEQKTPFNASTKTQNENVIRKRTEQLLRPAMKAELSAKPVTTIDEERARHEEISGMLINLSQSLIHRAKDIGKHVRNDNKILNNVEGQSRTAVDEIADQHKELKRQQRESGWCACGTYCLLVLVALSFLITYFMVKMFPKAH